MKDTEAKFLCDSCGIRGICSKTGSPPKCHHCKDRPFMRMVDEPEYSHGNKKQMKVKELLSDESKWTKGVLARNVNGYICSPTSSEAKCFCLLGAIDHCYADNKVAIDHSITKLKKAIYSHVRPMVSMTISTFNDYHASFEDIKKVLEIADI